MLIKYSGSNGILVILIYFLVDNDVDWFREEACNLYRTIQCEIHHSIPNRVSMVQHHGITVYMWSFTIKPLACVIAKWQTSKLGRNIYIYIFVLGIPLSFYIGTLFSMWGVFFSSLWANFFTKWVVFSPYGYLCHLAGPVFLMGFFLRLHLLAIIFAIVKPQNTKNI